MADSIHWKASYTWMNQRSDRYLGVAGASCHSILLADGKVVAFLVDKETCCGKTFLTCCTKGARAALTIDGIWAGFSVVNNKERHCVVGYRAEKIKVIYLRIPSIGVVVQGLWAGRPHKVQTRNISMYTPPNIGFCLF